MAAAPSGAATRYGQTRAVVVERRI
jgi:hypothetical protein